MLIAAFTGIDVFVERLLAAVASTAQLAKLGPLLMRRGKSRATS